MFTISSQLQSKQASSTCDKIVELLYVLTHMFVRKHKKDLPDKARKTLMAYPASLLPCFAGSREAGKQGRPLKSRDGSLLNTCV